MTKAIPLSQTAALSATGVACAGLKLAAWRPAVTR